MKGNLPSNSSACARARSSALLESTALFTMVLAVLLTFDFAVPLLQSTTISSSSASSSLTRTGGLSPKLLKVAFGRGVFVEKETVFSGGLGGGLSTWAFHGGGCHLGRALLGPNLGLHLAWRHFFIQEPNSFSLSAETSSLGTWLFSL